MLNLKHIAVSSFNENLAYIHRDCVAYKVDDIKTLTKVEIHGGVKPIFAFLQIVDDAKLVKPNELGLNTEAFELTFPKEPTFRLRCLLLRPVWSRLSAKLPETF